MLATHTDRLVSKITWPMALVCLVALGTTSLFDVPDLTQKAKKADVEESQVIPAMKRDLAKCAQEASDWKMAAEMNSSLSPTDLWTPSDDCRKAIAKYKLK